MIENEYSLLANESKQLHKVVTDNSRHITNIQQVTASIVGMIESLEREMDGLASVYGKVESLAAISEENSAASEEVSAAVQTYNNKLRNMIEKISEFKVVIRHFSEDVNQYRT